ncbi:penicillin-binding transpeptidase domain-containing protein [Miniphocaeibacter massiliensis]|uniref:penicillin-binding transpeptidase domain-containing protein n=1 Tax=Miniphocaeibacter massiliensis TaxID=2041841 RepID=UPI000C08C5C6|nr:penicillin-binding transpeptidase domain-containing protein [Miniphocaeibacter massiliensis]
MDSNSKKRFNRNFKTRTTYIFFICLLLVLVFAVRLIWLYNSKYRSLASEQRLKTIEIPASRGNIYDRNGKILAESIKISSLYYFPGNISDTDKIKLQSALRDILSLSDDKIEEILNSKERVKVSNKLTPEETKKIKDLKLNCLSISVENSRAYPLESSLSYVLGFVDSDNEGQYGIESKYNDILKGKPGLNLYTGTRDGDIISYDKNEKYSATAGSDISLTIDETINNIVSKASSDAYDKFNPKSISIIVTDVNKNEVLAMENFPRYNSNNPREGRTEEEKNEIGKLEGEEKLNKYYDIWRNISVSNVYEPGSVFKLITSAIAIEENTSNSKSEYYCNGLYKEIPGVTIRCVNWFEPHGKQTLKEALANSCNPSFVQIGQDIGTNKFYEYLKAFGFGQTTGIDIGAEETGLIPNNIEEIKPVRLATMSYGHGISVTPIQMITAANAVVNGGYIITPKLVKEIKSDEEDKTVEKEIKRQVISSDTSDQMKELMVNNVENGVASAVKMANYSIGGKSGTSIKIDDDGAYTSEKTVASFYSVFPMEKPEYSILVVVDEPKGQNSGNSVAGSISREIIKEIIDYQNIDKKVDINKEEEEIKVPNFTGETLKSAIKIAKDNNLRINIENTTMDDSIIITSQSIEEGTKVEEDTVVDLAADDTGKALIKVPNLENYSEYDVKKRLEDVNLKLVNKGDISKGKVLKTNPSAGELVESGSSLELIYE